VGLSQKALLTFDRLGSEARELARTAYKTGNDVSLHFLEALQRLCSGTRYTSLVPFVREGIQSNSIKIPSELVRLMSEADKQFEADRAAEAARRQEAAKIEALKAAELQALADNAAKVEASAALETATNNLPAGIKPPSAQNSDGPLQRPTYPIQELIDGTAFEGLQKQYEDDTAEFLADMREMSMALNTARKLAKKWHDTMKDRYSTSSVRDMLLWETYSRVWSETGKFKKLGNVTHVFDLYSRFADIAQEVKNFLLVAQPLTKLKRDRWGELVECRTSEEQQRYERK
jgi:hypothetical protein